MEMNSAGPRSCNIRSFPWPLGDPPSAARVANRPAGSVHPPSREGKRLLLPVSGLAAGALPPSQSLLQVQRLRFGFGGGRARARGRGSAWVPVPWVCSLGELPVPHRLTGLLFSEPASVYPHSSFVLFGFQ